MENSLLNTIEKRTGCLIGIIIATIVIGIIIGALSIVTMQAFQQLPPTPTPSPCLVGLDVRHDLYDTIEAYELNQFPIGHVESGIYPVVANTDELIAIDWRGSLSYPPPMHLLDWVAPVNGVDEIYGDCGRVIYVISATKTPF